MIVVITATIGRPIAHQPTKEIATPSSSAMNRRPMRFVGVPIGVARPPIDAAKATHSRSPVAKAGLRPNDVLWKLNEQWIFNPRQLAILLRTFKAGDEVDIAYLRKGKQQTAKVKLGEKELPSVDTPVKRGHGFWDLNYEVEKKEAKPGRQFRFEARPVKPEVRFWYNFGTRLLNDDQHEIRLETKKDGIWLKAMESGGRVLYDGRIKPLQEEIILPDDLNRKVDAIISLCEPSNLRSQTDVDNLLQRLRPGSRVRIVEGAETTRGARAESIDF